MQHILVVDDNLTNLRNIELFLRDHYRITLAKSGAQALQICIRQPFDMVLLDVEMPGMNGFEVIARLKQLGTLSYIPVIFLTGNNDVATEVRALDSGAVDFITKPVEKSILLHRIALHLRFAQYQQYLESTVKELENNLVISFSELIECRDENTGGHVQRTSKYVETLGTELLKKESFREELTEENLELIVRAAPLHDIGKIGISDTVLLKPGKLTESEYNLMKTHTTIGEEILANMYKRTPTQQYLRYAKVIAGGHHEKFDGTGYPNGLRGNAIPLCCRIMAVADVYDALVADRVYRKAVSHEAAYRIIVEGKNIDFDSKVVEAFEVCHEHLV